MDNRLDISVSGLSISGDVSSIGEVQEPVLPVGGGGVGSGMLGFLQAQDQQQGDDQAQEQPQPQPQSQLLLQTESQTESNVKSQPQTQQPQSHPQPLQEFTLFPTLPLELQLKIYNIINHTPRIVPIRYKTSFHKPSADEFSSSTHQGQNRNHTQGQGSNANGNNNNDNPNPPRLRPTNRLIQKLHPKKPRFTSHWASSLPPPPLLHTNALSRHLTQQVYTLSFASIESPTPHIYFNPAIDTLHFTGTGFSAYQLDLFLGGDCYGVSSRDVRGVTSLRLDVPEELYGRRGFCWGDVLGGFTGLGCEGDGGDEDGGLVLVVREEEEGGEVGGSLAASGTTTTTLASTGMTNTTTTATISSSTQKTTTSPAQERLMKYYKRSLQRVWDSYIAGEGEGDVGGEGATRWKVPRIEVWNELTGRSWGLVKLEGE